MAVSVEDWLEGKRLWALERQKMYPRVKEYQEEIDLIDGLLAMRVENARLRGRLRPTHITEDCGWSNYNLPIEERGNLGALKSLRSGEVLAFETWIEGPPIFAARIVTSTSPRKTKIQWFNSEAEAQATMEKKP